MNKFDVIIIGSGINSLVAGAILSKERKRVLVLERNDWLGGCIKTVDDLTLPNFVHEELASWHPLFVTSPGYTELKEDLEVHGLKYVNTEIPTGVVLPNGDSAVLYNDREKNIELFNRIAEGDGDRYAEAMTQFEKNADMIFTVLSNNVQTWTVYKKVYKAIRQKGMANFRAELGALMGTARDFLENNFTSDKIKALLAPWILHTGLGPDEIASNAMLQVLAFSLEQASMPIPEGGGKKLVAALQKMIEKSDGVLLTNKEVTEITIENKRVTGVKVRDEKYSAKYVLANVTPQQLYTKLLPRETVHSSLYKRAEKFKYGNAGMQIHYAISEQLQWNNEELNKAALINITGGIKSVSVSVNEAANGLLPKEPTIAVGQHTVLDPTRAPEGQHTLWIQLLELPRKPVGDALGKVEPNGEYTDEIVSEIVERVENEIAKHTKNFKEIVLKRKTVSPKKLEQYNPNLVGGNPYAGEAKLDQLLMWRPNGFSKTHETMIKNLYHIGASTHPGPGLNGSSGYLAAKAIR